MASLLDGITICIPGHDGQEVQLTFSHASWGKAITFNYDGTVRTITRPEGWDPNSGIRWEQTVTLPFTGETVVNWTDVEGGDTPHSATIKVLEVACPVPETTTTAPPPPADTSTTTTVAATTTSAPATSTTVRPTTTTTTTTASTVPTTSATTTPPAVETTVAATSTTSTVPTTTTVPTTITFEEPTGCCSGYIDETTTTIGVPPTLAATGYSPGTAEVGGLFLLFGLASILAVRLVPRRG